MRNSNTLCKQCALPLYARPASTGNVFCSRQCSGLNQRSNTKLCPVCGAQFNGRKKRCSRACANKSRVGIKYDGTRSNDKAENSKRLKFQVALKCNGVCQKCGWDNYHSLQVHHTVERANGGTDDLSNLELLCANCHTAHHYGIVTFEEINYDQAATMAE